VGQTRAAPARPSGRWSEYSLEKQGPNPCWHQRVTHSLRCDQATPASADSEHLRTDSHLPVIPLSTGMEVDQKPPWSARSKLGYCYDPSNRRAGEPASSLAKSSVGPPCPAQCPAQNRCLRDTIDPCCPQRSRGDGN
jgi:hypothetical protein